MSKTRDVLPIGSTTFLRLQQSSDDQSRHAFFVFVFMFFKPAGDPSSATLVPDLANQVWPFKSALFNPFTATGRIYTSPKRPSRWPRTYNIRPTSISFLRICQSPATGVVVVACLQGVFFVSSLIAACSSGPFSLRKQFFYASRGFCPNGGKQRCGCSQMRQMTSWYELYVWWLSLRRRSRRELSWFRLVESEGYE